MMEDHNKDSSDDEAYFHTTSDILNEIYFKYSI